MDHDQIKAGLLSRRAELLGDIAHRQDEATSVTSEDSEDKQAERLEDEVLAALAVSDRDEIARIDAALAKMADGSYGSCENCGQDIAPARLKALPDALLCIDCAAAAEG